MVYVFLYMAGIIQEVSSDFSDDCSGKACFPLGEFVHANREKSNLIGWRQTLTTSPPNHICFLLVRAKKIAKWKTGLMTVLIHQHAYNFIFQIRVRQIYLVFDR